MAGPERVMVYRDPVAQHRDEAEAAAHGWSVVTREFLPDGTLRVLFRYGSPGVEGPAAADVVVPQVEPSPRGPGLGLFAAIVLGVIVAIGVLGLVSR